jgi:hypothetical protein
MRSSLDKAAEYRRIAEENRKVAKFISIADGRVQLLATAAKLEQFAEAEEQLAAKRVFDASIADLALNSDGLAPGQADASLA